MGKKEFLLFQDKDIKPCVKEILEEAEGIFQDTKDEFRMRFVREFSSMCEKMKKNGDEMKPGYFMYHLLRTDLVRGIYRCPVIVYDRNWYFHKGIRAGELETGKLFCLYGKLWNNLSQRAKRYVGHVKMPEVDRVMQEMVTVFYRYLKEMILYSVSEATETESYRTMKKEEDFQIRLGEYLEPGDLVYQEQPVKDIEEVKKWLAKNEKEAYCFEDFKGLDLSSLMLQNHDFRYTDFRGAALEKTNFSLSLLIGASFRNCHMKEVNLAGSLFHNADFTGADLEGADLSYGLTYQGKGPADTWRNEGYTGSSFRNSNLQGACFKRGVYDGADFRGARLVGSDFTEAALYGSRFTRKQAEEAKLGREQLEQIHMTV
ncbi:pentapeptide repeat-containing protein [Clostridium sp. Marseille-P2415]|uniref:pentapeptide repeat-containing protein n=1 Tax=Clostridium sp. Marseille-P2415 TaxID=1805471 RepID=UPI00098887A8|nr:pentapeptide repeat-containing protein [Clostridium sp. Marseille-P2415]